MRLNMKLWLVVALVPWLMGAFLTLHYYIQTGYFSFTTLLLWGGFGVAALAIIYQISRRQAQVATNERRETHYRDLVETAHDLVWTMDLRGCWTYLNKAAKIIYGYEPQEMLYRPISKFVSPEHPDRESIPFAETRSPDPFESSTPKPGGSEIDMNVTWLPPVPIASPGAAVPPSASPHCCRPREEFVT